MCSRLEWCMMYMAGNNIHRRLALASTSVNVVIVLHVQSFERIISVLFVHRLIDIFEFDRTGTALSAASQRL